MANIIEQHLLQAIGLSSNSTWFIVDTWLFCRQYLPSLVSLWCMLEVVWRLEWRTSYITSLRFKLILACQEVLKQVWSSINQTGLLFIQIQTLPPNMRHNWKEIIGLVWYAKTSNERSKGINCWSPIELEDISKVCTLIEDQCMALVHVECMWQSMFTWLNINQMII